MAARQYAREPQAFCRWGVRVRTMLSTAAPLSTAGIDAVAFGSTAVEPLVTDSAPGLEGPGG